VGILIQKLIIIYLCWSRHLWQNASASTSGTSVVISTFSLW